MSDTFLKQRLEENNKLMVQLNAGTATKADKERILELSKEIKEATAMKTMMREKERSERAAASPAVSTSDTFLKQRLEENNKLMVQLNAGTATKADKERILELSKEIKEATAMKTMMREKERSEKATASPAVSTSDTFLKQRLEENNKLMVQLNAGTATKADKERILELSKEIKEATAMKTMMREKERSERVAASPAVSTSDTFFKQLLEENNKLMVQVNAGTATKADKERILELSKEIKAATAMKTKMREEERCKSEDKIRHLEIKLRQQELNELHRLFVAAEQVDLAFMCDCTGSMADHLRGVVNQIFAIVDSIKTSNPRLCIRLAFLGYRDHCDFGRFEISDFQPSVDVFKNFVNEVIATGGEDGPEDIAGALQNAAGLSWTQTSRVLFHIADAPCHGSRYHSMGDDYPAGDPNGLDMVVLVRAIKALGVEYYFGKMNDSTEQMLHMINAEFPGGYIRVVNIADAAKLTVAVASSVAKSVTAKTAMLVKSKKGKAAGGVTFAPMEEKPSGITLVSTVPDWATVKEKSAVAYTHGGIKSVEELQHPLKVTRATPSDCTASHELRCKVAPKPFQNGQSRLVYYGMIHTATGWSERLFKEFIPKGYKFDIQDYLQQIENSTVARYLADEYNKIKPKHCLPIEFLGSHIFEIPSEGKFYCIERELEGGFKKYSSNIGYWNPELFEESLARFSLWSLKVTEGYLMVSDLQGVKTSGGFHLTDPVILCKDVTRFGNTNIGPSFMDDVKSNAERLLRLKGLAIA